MNASTVKKAESGDVIFRIVLTVIIGLMSIQTTILLAGIPWAYSVHGRLTGIEGVMETRSSLISDLLQLRDRVLKLELEKATREKEKKE